MTIKLQQVTPQAYDGDALLVGVFEDTNNTLFDNLCTTLQFDASMWKPKLGKLRAVHTLGKLPVSVVVCVGLGKKADLSLEKFRNTLASAATCVRDNDGKKIGIALSSFGNSAELAEAAVIAVGLGLYQFTTYKTEKKASKSRRSCCTCRRIAPNNRTTREYFSKRSEPHKRSCKYAALRYDNRRSRCCRAQTTRIRS